LRNFYKEIYHIIAGIHHKVGKSLESWLNESLRNSAHGGEYEAKEEASISTYKEQFKTMLSLDLWIDKLFKWQIGEYKQEMPKKEPVDLLHWNTVLKAKLHKVMNGEELNIQTTAQIKDPSCCYAAPNQTVPSKETDIVRKRAYNMDYSGIEPDKYRQVKMKKVYEKQPDITKDSVISTDKTSEISLVVRHSTLPRVRPAVSMPNIFKHLAQLKKEVKQSVFDEKNKNVVHLSHLESDQMDISL
jgi:hypothetical protein